MKKRFSWILISLAVYVAGLIIYVFRDNAYNFWSAYYWFLNTFVVVVALCAALKGFKTHREKVALCFILLSKVLLTLYYVYCLAVLHAMSEMEGTIVFWVALMVAGFLSVSTRKLYIHGK